MANDSHGINYKLSRGKVCFALMTVMIMFVASAMIVEVPSEGEGTNAENNATITFEEDGEATNLEKIGDKGTYSYESGILCLEGIDFKTTDDTAIEVKCDLEIKIIGNNTITCETNNEESYGIKVVGEKTLTIHGDEDGGELTISSKGENDPISYGIHCVNGTLIVGDNLVLNASVGESKGSAGINAKRLEITGSNTFVNSRGGDYGGTSSFIGSYGIECLSLDVRTANIKAFGGNITSGSDHSSSGLYMYQCNNVSITDATIDFEGGNCTGLNRSLGAYIVFKTPGDPYIIENSTITLVGNGGCVSYGLVSVNDVEMNNCTITMMCGNDAALMVQPKIMIDVTQLEGKESEDQEYQKITDTGDLAKYHYVRTIAFSVTYDIDGGSGSAPIQPDVVPNKTFTVADYKGTKDGYEFKGWSDGMNTYQPGDIYTMGEAPVTLTAIWESSSISHTVTYDANGGDGDVPEEASYLKGKTFTVADYKGTKDGYEFKGWSDGKKTYQPGDKYKMGDKDVKFTAVWEKVATETNPNNNIMLIMGVVVLAVVSMIGCMIFTADSNGGRKR